MEDTRVLVSTSWQEMLQNEKHKNWVKVGYALFITCKGIRSYIEREAILFHATLTATLHGLPPCTCTHTPRRRPNPHHNMSICSWARELEKHHIKGKPTWNQSDSLLWNDPNVGHWEVAKLFMPYGCGKGNSCAETDATGLLNLLCWCNHYETDAPIVERLKDTRNTWAHAATQELDATETTDAFLSMKNALQDTELIGDTDAKDALNEITVLENDALIDFKDLEIKVVGELRQSMTSMKDELVSKFDSMKDQEDFHASEIKDDIMYLQTILIYCMKVGQGRDDVLLHIESGLCDMQGQIDILLQSRPSTNKETSMHGETIDKSTYDSLKNISLVVILLIKLLRTVPRKVILVVFLLSTITILDETLDEIGCGTRESSKELLDLQEIDFTLQLNRKREGFVGRQWLFNTLSDSLNQEEYKGVMIIAAPGFGKSSLISNLICSKLSRFSLHSQILGYHLCIHSHKNTQDGAVFVRNLASMIADRLQEYESLVERDKFIQKILKHDKCSSDPTGCFEQGILAPLSRLRLRFLEPTMYIVVDALDECFTDNKKDKGTSIVDIISNNIKMFPNWLKVILTSRNVTNIRMKFSSLDIIDFYPDDQRNLQDIERFVFSQLSHSLFFRMKSIFADDSSLQAMVDKSQGNFLYIKLVLEYLKTKGISVATWNSLPTSINSIYQEFFERTFDTKKTFSHSDPQKIFEILVATLTPLTTEELYNVFVTNLTDPDNFHFENDFLLMLEDLSMYLSTTQEKQIVTVFHNSLTEWLTSASNKRGEFYVDAKKGSQLLADYYFKKIHDKAVNITPRFVYNLATYIVQGSSMKRNINNFNKLDPKLIRVTDETNLTALHSAAGDENEETFALLLNIFKNADIEDNSGRTPAFYAVTFGRLANLRLLHLKGASMVKMTSISTCGNPNTEEDSYRHCERQMCGYSLFHVACQRGHTNIVLFLLKNNVSISTLTGLGSSAMHLAAKYSYFELSKSLIKHGVVPDGRCLYYASLHGNYIAVRLFLKNGAEDTCMDCSKIPRVHLKGQFQFRNLNDRQNYRQHCNTALHIAASKNLSKVAEVLLKSKRTAVHCINYYGRNPLLDAVENSNYEVTKMILKSSANPSTFCNSYLIMDSMPYYCPCGYTPLHVAAHNGFTSITKLLLKYKADYNATDCKGQQPIHVASCHGHIDVLSVLVKKGADINSKGPKDMTPMHYACRCQKDGIFDKLFELGANGTSLTSDGNTPLHYIIQRSSTDEDFYLMDPYASFPIDPIDEKRKRKYPWMISMTRFLMSFKKGKSDELNSIADLSLATLFIDIVANVSKSMLGSLQPSSWEYVALTSPLFYASDIGMLSKSQKLTDKIDSMPVVDKWLLKAKIRTDTDCSFLINIIEMNLLYCFDNQLDMGYDVNCQILHGTSTPLLVYLRQGGRNMAKVLVKHRVIADIQCGTYFEDSVFHLAAYHKLHYLQYISVFRDPVQWEEYLKNENALFDYLFDEYGWRTVDGQLRIIKVRDGPVTKSIKKHPRGYKIIDECLDREGYTALHRAAQGGNVVAVKHFLDWGANLTIRNQDGFDPLVLSIWYAVKYRPYFNFHKPSLSTSLEIEFASLTASVIVSHLTRDKPFHVGCDENKKVPTLLHLAATRGMWRFIDELFIARDNFKVTGLTANCPTKDHITPMYLAKLHGGDNCEWDNPWCKVVGILLKYGASMIYPDPLTEYFLVFNFLFHELPGRLNLDLNKEERKLFINEDDVDCSNLHGDKYHLLLNNFKPKTDAHFDLCMLVSICTLSVTETKFELAQSMFNSFLTIKLIHIKSSFSYLKEVDDATLRCVKQNYYQKQMQITDNNEQNVKEFEYELGNGVFTDIDLDIEFPPNFFSSSEFEDLDMCSSKAVVTFNILEEYLKKNHQVFVKKYKSLIKNIRLTRQKFRRCQSQFVKEVLDPSITIFINYYKRPQSCRLKETTYKHTQLKFLLHTIKFWNSQVQKMSFYPSISKFVSERIQDVLLSEHRKEMAQLILRLSDEDCLTNYKYLEMLRFTKPPMFDRTIKYT